MPLSWITFVLPKCKVEKSEALQPRRLQIAFRKQGGPEAYFDASVPHRYVNAGQETTKMTLLIQYFKKSSIVTGA